MGRWIQLEKFLEPGRVEASVLGQRRLVVQYGDSSLTSHLLDPERTSLH